LRIRIILSFERPNADYSAMKDFLSATRRQIISSLQGGDRTVAELSAELGLTDNAVRSHLDSLQRQQLVVTSGLRSGTRKPHTAYALTLQAKRIFFEGCEPLLNQLISVLSAQLKQPQFEKVLRECGRRMAQACSPTGSGRNLQERIEFALTALKTLGGQAAVEQQAGKMVIRGAACPWAAVVANHPEVCLAAEALLGELTGVPVKEHCARDQSPHCVFQIG
jgi:DeoR family suf operon transcriptional repressor